MNPRPARTYLLSCGGTGGHLTPGIALAEALQARGDRAVLLISEKRIDARLAAKYSTLRFEPVPGAPFGMHPRDWARFLVSQMRGLAFARRLVRAERPAAVVGFGGFTTAGVVLAARLAGVPVALHEANRVPGKAVRLFARLARRVWLPLGVSLSGAAAARVRAAGLPVRREIVRRSRAEAAAAFGLDSAPGRKILAVLGGSQGAGALNAWAREAAPALAARGVQLVCVTGPGKGEAGRFVQPGPDGGEVVQVWMPFCDDVAGLLSAADLVVARAGAGSLAEFARVGAPSVLVPLPHAADDHQRANAAWFAARGGARVLEQADLGRLTALVLELLADASALAAMRAGLAGIDAGPGLDFILADLDAEVAPLAYAGAAAAHVSPLVTV